MQRISDDESLEKKLERLNLVFTESLKLYRSKSCQCAFPRFLQIVGIDCVQSGDSFMCYETEVLIGMSKSFFEITSRGPNASGNETWICKTCGSVYEYNWSDFSIQVARQTLQLQTLKSASIGLPALKPIPLYAGLTGHSYPSRDIIHPVSFPVFEKYMSEQ